MHLGSAESSHLRYQPNLTSLAHCLQPLGAVHSLGGDLSPLPFQSLLNASEDRLKCFQGGLGQATDTYTVSWRGVG